ncbi:MAG: rhodanese-like domain-containing protein [Minisyncoccota bacterium]
MSNEITVTDAAKRINEDNGIRILDVRTPDEHARGHIEGSSNLDFYNGNFKSEIEKLDHSKAYIVYCASGGRSGKTVRMMDKLSFNACYNLIGGFSEWAREGMKVVK